MHSTELGLDGVVLLHLRYACLVDCLGKIPQFVICVYTNQDNIEIILIAISA